MSAIKKPSKDWRNSRDGGTDFDGEWYASHPPRWTCKKTILPYEPRKWENGYIASKTQIELCLNYAKSDKSFRISLRYGDIQIVDCFHGKAKSLNQALLTADKWQKDQERWNPILKQVGRAIYIAEYADHVYRIEPDGSLTPFCSCMRIAYGGGASCWRMSEEGWDGRDFIAINWRGELYRLTKLSSCYSSGPEKDAKVIVKAFRWTKKAVPGMVEPL